MTAENAGRYGGEDAVDGRERSRRDNCARESSPVITRKRTRERKTAGVEARLMSKQEELSELDGRKPKESDLRVWRPDGSNAESQGEGRAVFKCGHRDQRKQGKMVKLQSADCVGNQGETSESGDKKRWSAGTVFCEVQESLQRKARALWL